MIYNNCKHEMCRGGSLGDVFAYVACKRLKWPFLTTSSSHNNPACHECSQDGLQNPPTNSTLPPLQPPSGTTGCASPGFFFTASSQSAINQAMQTMFFQALQVARLTQ